MRSTAGRVVRGRLVQGADGIWRETAVPAAPQAHQATYSGEMTEDPEAFMKVAYIAESNPRQFTYTRDGKRLIGSALAFAQVCSIIYGSSPLHWYGRTNRTLIADGLRVVPHRNRVSSPGGDGTYRTAKFWEREI